MGIPADMADEHDYVRLEKQRELLLQTAQLVGAELSLQELFEQLAALLGRFFDARAVEIAVGDEDAMRTEYVFRSDAGGGHSTRSTSVTIRFGGTVEGALKIESRAAKTDETGAIATLEACATYVGARLREERSAGLAQIALTDALTGLANRRAFDEALQREWRRCARSQTNLALAMLDVDFFKRFNDAYGHVSGDACLRRVALAIARCVNRPSDVVARYGGEEFAVVLPDSDGDAAVHLGEAICAAVRAMVIPHDASSLGYVTVSVGVVSLVPAGEEDSRSLVAAADARLYEAKENGRNRVAGEDYRSEAPAAKPRLLVRHNLPRYPTSSVGLDPLVDDVAALLRGARLASIVGPGGIGKTRLAVQTANTLLDAYDDGAWFVDLAPIDDPVRLPGAIAAALDLRDEGDSRPAIERVCAALKSKKLLLVLDNCEHLIVAAADAAQRLTQLCPDIAVLATSREQLGVAGEGRYHAPPLPVPPADADLTARAAMEYGAVALFAARARASKRSFVLTDANAGMVADILRRVDGVPLAIELVAARVTVSSLSTLRERLDERFTPSPRDERAPLQRHETLQTLIGWSYDLLDEEERALLRRLALFRGGWALSASEAVCADERTSGTGVSDLLASLVNKSLVVLDFAGDRERYRLLESTRAFALEHLAGAEHDQIAAAHCRYFAELARRAEGDFWLHDFDEWTATVAQDMENYRSAIAWGLAEGGDVSAAAAIVASLRNMWYRSARREGNALVERAAAALGSGGSARERGRLAVAAALLSHEAARDEAALADAARAFSDARDRTTQAEALTRLVWAVGHAGRLDDALALCERALEVVRKDGAPRQVASVLTHAYWFGIAGNPERTRACFDEAAAILRDCNDRGRLAILQTNRAEFLSDNGDLMGALACGREAEALYRERRYESGLYFVLNNVAGYELAAGLPDDAWASAREALEITQRVGDAWQSALAIGHLAHVAASAGDTARALRLLGYVDAALSRTGMSREGSERSGYEQAMKIVRTSLPEDEVRGLLAGGASMDERTAVEEAMAISKP